MAQQGVENAEEALIKIFDDYYTKVYNYFRYHLARDTEAQDLAGEVFMRVASAFSRYDRTKAGISTWIFTIARNVLIDYFRKTKYQRVELTDHMASEDDPIGSMMKKESIRALRQALLRLTEKERELIALKYSAGMKNTEIALVLGLSAGNVGIMLFRSIEKLRGDMKDFL
ncbi:hypothetical protein DCMF_26575 [Candidatus Formimonas warabiya]|uniref:Sigma-70 family RNA polymerase sigma factor n=2 Tax=Formimonas warabiya TaxID=1761012 RepID=A0A3G1KZ94_FORW1|nr:hypothetical protein DCMF_26575 [Candidatus Formimonas warabiya]